MALLSRRKAEEDWSEEEAEDSYEYEMEDVKDEDSGLIDYDVYVMSARERAAYIVLAAVAIFTVGMIFYHNIIFAGILSVAALKFPKIRTKQIIAKRKRELSVQFKDLLYALSASMSAGQSLESAFEKSIKDLEVLYPDPETPIMQETIHIVRCLSMNMTAEEAISQFAERSHIEDVQNFADVIRICKRSGGNLIEVVRSTSQMIGDKIETKNEIETTITVKRFESRILTMTPIGMVAILSYTSPDYMAPVFRLGIGPIVMTVAIVMFVIAFFVSEKMMDIEV